ncbi:MAG TPA: isoprenyl transferase [Rhodospirillaceae bacterium]|nr:di-trans,poly-cis-decaprenylcistransferase [Rhodospirillaceae bacterium]MBL25430.1 di-trans,poly-cis-decaprenylcistransferase [Rhodospirillaceae bacterium]HAT36810.1 isoprenyl transferase [Rhodospirillaceae bacterium]
MDKDLKEPPTHVAIVMDGNGRWAKARGLPRSEGHRRGAESARKAVQCAADLGIQYLTLFSFSSENWSRSASEIEDLMGLLRWYLRSETAELHKNNVRLKVIGERSRLPKDIVELIENAETTMDGNTGLTLILALSYGGRQDIVAAARILARQVAEGALQSDAIDESLFGRYLATGGIPDPDLLIRTSGEQRISNFLIWQLAYTEFVFTEVLWPDFDDSHFENAVAEFRRRDRRYGATVDSR